jgi:hypothetical protein
LRNSPISSTQRRTRPWPSAKRQARRLAANDDALVRQGWALDPQPADGIPLAGWLLSHCSATARHGAAKPSRATRPGRSPAAPPRTAHPDGRPAPAPTNPVKVGGGEERCRLVLDQRLLLGLVRNPEHGDEPLFQEDIRRRRCLTMRSVPLPARGSACDTPLVEDPRWSQSLTQRAWLKSRWRRFQLGELPAAVEVAAYAITAEAVANAVRHSGRVGWRSPGWSSAESSTH